MRSTRAFFWPAFDRRMGWQHIARDGVDVRVVPGDHEDILWPPNVEVLARELTPFLSKSPPVEARRGVARARCVHSRPA